MQRITCLSAALAVVATIAPSSASASHTALHQAACNYRHAVVHFEQVVCASPFMNPYQKLLVHRLADASRLVHLASSHPCHDVTSVTLAWRHVQILQPQVQAVIFHDTCCPSRTALLPCWERVTCASEQLAVLLAPTCPATISPAHSAPVPPLQTPPIPRAPALPHASPGYESAPVAPAPDLSPAAWRHRRDDWRRPREVNPFWNASQGVPGRVLGRPAYGRSAPDGHAQAPRATHPVYSFKGIDAVKIGALISRLID